MADEINEVQVEKLTLQIDVKGATASQTKKINAFADSLKNLDKALSESLLNRIEKLNKLNLGFGKVTGLSKMAKSMAKNQKAMEKSLLFPSISNNIESKTSQENNLPSTNLNQPKNENVIDAEYTEKTIKTYKTFGATLKDLKKVSGALQKTFGGLTRTLKKGARMIGIVIAYSLAFKALQVVTQGVSEGISNLAVFDKQANKTMSELTTATQNLKNAIGMIAMPIVQIITPAIQNISNWIVNIANKISEIRASAQGLATYTKISSKYMNDYAKSLQGTSFSFDSFTALQSSVFDMYDTEQVAVSADEANNSLLKMKNTLIVVGGLLSALKLASTFSIFGGKAGLIAGAIAGVASMLVLAYQNNDKFKESVDNLFVSLGNLIKPIGELVVKLADALLPIITTLASLLGTILTPVLQILSPIINGIASIVSYVFGLISNFITENLDKINTILTFVEDVLKVIFITLEAIGKSIETVLTNQPFEQFKQIWADFAEDIKEPLAGVANFFISILNFIISGFQNLLNKVIGGINELTGKLSDLWSWIGIPAIPQIPEVSWSGIPMLANGGMVNAGSLFIAGEQGAELLTNMGSGTTGVTNVSQFKQAMIEAIYETGLLSSIEESGNIYLDSEKVGKKMGQTKSLRQQLNRTNPNLNLK
jgi:hypothetical protein